MHRFRTSGRSIVLGGEKFHARGVTYGTFRRTDGHAFPAPARVEEDFAAMAAAGVNSIRTYERPPGWLLDRAVEHGLQVMVGLAWEQHLAFLDEPDRAGEISARIRAEVERCAAHPAILCYSVGNEIPAAIVRWHGKRAIERFVERLFEAAKEGDPDGLVTYVNYPSTEYLELPFLDLAAFNVYLEDERAYAAYVDRLQNLAGDRPLLLTEVGIDSRRGGEEEQARALDWQLRRGFAAGAAGAFVFAWTDEWHRGGHDVLDWDFGVVDRERRPKPALAAMSGAFADAPLAAAADWPAVSVVVCTYNGARTLEECLAHVEALDYPDFELIVVVDGGADACAEIARAHGATVLETPHAGLGHARNVGIAAARGEIVAFLDDDAFPDRDWLLFVADRLRPGARGGYAGVGGPNIPPVDDGFVAACVAAAPGGPIHVLVSDSEAEHVPGCNMAFRKEVLEEVGGFDERFRVAGDDVDICWRLQQAGHRLGFSAGAVVMHRRRDSVRRYLRQQYGYGKAEALLERKWPSRYNRAGSSRWSGRIYDAPAQGGSRRRPPIHYGTWGGGLFQSIYDPVPGRLAGFLTAPEALLALVLLAVISALGELWSPLLAALPLLAIGLAAFVWRAAAAGWRAVRVAPGHPRGDLARRRALTALLFLAQPVARLAGRLRKGLSPWRRRLRPGAAWPRPRTVAVWNESWTEPRRRLQALQDALAENGGLVRSGGPYDRWDLELRSGPLAGARIRTAVEEHGHGRQLLRARIWPRASVAAVVAVVGLALLAVATSLSGRTDIGIVAACAAVVIVVLGLEGAGSAMSLALAQTRALEGTTVVEEEEDRAPAPEPTPAPAAEPAPAGRATAPAETAVRVTAMEKRP
ncbi:MAG: glycosyltransferase [Actinobacteria bacterium]|nr:glycosyltransferase [Actinomycetota bacterium]